MSGFSPAELLWGTPKLCLWVPLFACLADAVAKDPVRLPHPVQGIGRAAQFLEPVAKRISSHWISMGAISMCILCCTAGGIVWSLTHIPFPWSLLTLLYFSWAGLALGSLLREGKKALACIDAAKRQETASHETSPELAAARQAVGMLVSRDVQNLSPDDLYRTLAETLSENFTDGFIAPLFWLCLTGPTGLWVYKTVSTLDSLWGYKTDRFLYFGRAAARCDDVLAFIPARCAAVLLFFTRPRTTTANWPGWKTVRRQALQLASPNAGWTMACAAWLHSGSMGGPASYHGKLVDKPLMGPGDGRWDHEKNLCLMRHLQFAGGAGAVLFPLLASLIRLAIS